jgi:hypothetical protein
LGFGERGRGFELYRPIGENEYPEEEGGIIDWGWAEGQAKR